MAASGQTFTPSPRFETYSANKKTAENQDQRSDQIDALQRLSAEDRRTRLDGDDYFDDIEGFYTLRNRIMQAPSYRPQVDIPQLQTLMLSEATDLADSQPIIYIAKRDQRDEAREKALQNEWRQGFINLEIFMAELWANLCGTGILQFGFDPYARNGAGQVWFKSRNPREVYPDPSASDDESLTYLVIEDRLYLDTIKRNWPETSIGIRRKGRSASSSDTPTPGSAAFTLQVTPGPMRYAGGGYSPQTANQALDDGRYRVRWCWVQDSSTKDVDPEVARAASGLVVPPSKVLRYPNGRLIIDCEGVVLFDGPSWCPHRSFPIVRFVGLPPLSGYWGVPPTRYTRDLQIIAQKMLGLTYENGIRLNNGTVLISQQSGVSSDTYLGLPGEIVVYKEGTTPPRTEWPAPMPQHLTQLPLQLLALQKEMHGYTQTRQGNPGAGNVGSDLFDSAVGQSQKLTTMKGLFMAQSVQRVAEMLFYMMAKYSPDRAFFNPEDDGSISLQRWQALGEKEIGAWQVWVDPGSIRPQSASVLRRMVPELRKLGMIDTRNALHFLNVPNADQIADLIEQEQKLAALAKLKRK